VAHSQRLPNLPPPRASDFDKLAPWHMSLDEAVHIALGNSPVILDQGGRVLAHPGSVHTRFDPTILATDPNMGAEAALSAFDTRFETGFAYNGGQRMVNSAYASGQFGVFSQPETLATAGLGRVLSSGTKVSIIGMGGYDEELSGGPFAAYGGEVRHPLMRKAGTEFNKIAGPLASPGNYRGVLIAQIDERKSQLELERAVRDLVRDVTFTYWELHFAYQNLDTSRTALQNARQSWSREQQRTAEQVTPADSEALARQQFYSAEAGVRNAIGGGTGVYNVELKLRTLLALPACDGRLIRPTAGPLEAEFCFDWQESEHLAQSRRIEVRRQLANIEQSDLKLRAARNLRRPQLDLVGQYRRLGDDPANLTATFSEAQHGWQIGVEYSRVLGNRREKAAVRNAELRLCRERALLVEQQRHVSAELRIAFTELDRAFGVMQSQAASRAAAVIRLQAEAERHAAGDTHVERVLEAQLRAKDADTAYQRSLVDYSLAFVKLHLARGTFLDTMGVGFAGQSSDEYRFAQKSPCVFASQGRIDPTQHLIANPLPATVQNARSRIARLPPTTVKF